MAALQVEDFKQLLAKIDGEKSYDAEELEKQFQTMAEASKAFKLENSERLITYCLYKQTTVGDVNSSQPWAINIVERAKWDAWAMVKGFDKESAKKLYVYICQEIFEGKSFPKPPFEVSAPESVFTHAVDSATSTT